MGALLGTFALGMLGGGCGRGEDPPTVPLDKAQFIKRADAICESENQRFQELFENYVDENDIGLPPERSLAQWTGIVENAFAPTVEGKLERIRALGTPRGDSRQVNRVLHAIEDGLQQVRRDPSVEADVEAEFERSSRLARAYGFTICGD